MAGFIETTSRSSKNRSYKTLASDFNTAARHMFYEACKSAWWGEELQLRVGCCSHYRLEFRHGISNAVFNSNDAPIETFQYFFRGQI